MLFNIVVGRHDAPNYLLIYAMDSKTGNSDQDIIEITSQLDEPLESVHSIMNYLAFIYNAKKEYFIEFDEGKLIGYNSNTSLLYMEPYLILDNSRLASVEVDSATGKLCIKFFARQMPLGELMQKEDDIKINKGPAISPSNLSKHKNKQPVIERIKEATHMHILPNTKQEKEDEYKVDIKDKKKKIKTIEPYWKKLIYGNTDR